MTFKIVCPNVNKFLLNPSLFQSLLRFVFLQASTALRPVLLRVGALLLLVSLNLTLIRICNPDAKTPKTPNPRAHPDSRPNAVQPGGGKVCKTIDFSKAKNKKSVKSLPCQSACRSNTAGRQAGVQFADNKTLSMIFLPSPVVGVPANNILLNFSPVGGDTKRGDKFRGIGGLEVRMSLLDLGASRRDI